MAFNNLYFNFYKIILKGYQVVGGRKRCIWVDFGEENRARGGTVHEPAQTLTEYSQRIIKNSRI